MRFLPTRFAFLATSSTASKMRSGDADPRSRARMSTSNVESKLGESYASPHAHLYRRSNCSRSTASLSLSPSKRCSTITVAITRGAMLRRPRFEYRSANIASGNSSPPCSASSRKRFRSPTARSHSSLTDRKRSSCASDLPIVMRFIMPGARGYFPSRAEIRRARRRKPAVS
jgi:hypothetical protein